MITIREARGLDREELVHLAVHFATTVDPYVELFAGLDARAVCGRTVDLLLNLAEEGLAAIFVAVDGDDIPYAGLAICENVNLLTGEKFGDEIAWWVEPAQRSSLRVGPKLLGVAEKWTHQRGLTSIKMVAPQPSAVGVFYERAGYRPIETAYRKVLT
jgi:hypothetical protein